MTDKTYLPGAAFVLREPIAREDGSGTISSVTLARPKGRAIREVSEAPEGFGQAAAMVRGVTGLSDRDLDEIDGEDLVELIEIAAGFFDRSGSAKAT